MTQELHTLQHTLNQLFEERNNLFPRRDPQNTQAVQKTLNAYISILNHKQPNWTPEQEFVARANMFKENVVFICGSMKSGTTLITNLLDNHPSLVVMPTDSHFINFYEELTKITAAQKAPSCYTGRLKGWDTYWVSRFINPSGQKPFWILGDNEKAYIDFLQYLEYWLNYLPDGKQNDFLAVVLAFYGANPNRAPVPKLWVEKTPGNEEKAKEILNLYTKARFIHIVRDPYSNIASLKRLTQARGRPWNVENFAFRIRGSMALGLSNQTLFGKERYYLLRYEDLVTNTASEMTKIADFLDIAMEETLLTPTVNGLPAISNSMYKSRQISGQVSGNIQDKWKTELSAYEQQVISAVAYRPAAQQFHYEGYESNFMYYYWAYLKRWMSRARRRIGR